MKVTYWDHQDRIHKLCQQMWSERCSRWCVVAPCGAGKTRMICRIIAGAVSRGLKVAIYSCRIQNTQQLMDMLDDAGIQYGTVAAAYRGKRDITAPVQVCQLQTVVRASGAIPNADIVIVDEAHQQVSRSARFMFDLHERAGCKAIIGYTATPVNLAGAYNKILPGPTFAELLECKAHLPARVFVPDVPRAVHDNDTSVLKVQSSGELSSRIDAQINNYEEIHGRVYDKWRELNPDALPAVLFAPDVQAARGYVNKFAAKGVRTASIDSNSVVICRKDFRGVDIYKASPEARQDVIEGSKDGTFKIVHNRFILRESVNMPWLFHAIICSTMTGLSTYLQSVGRVLRYWPHYDHVIIQDHSGSFDRHGMPNEDRLWALGATNNSMHQEYKKRRKPPAEVSSCIKCGRESMTGSVCLSCKEPLRTGVRMVRERDGSLVEVTIKAKKKRAESFERILRNTLYQFKHSQKGQGTVQQAYAIAKKKASLKGLKQFDTGDVHFPSRTSDQKRSVKDYYKGRKI